MAADPTTGVKQAAPPTDFNAVNVVEKSAPIQPKVAPKLPPALPTGPPHPALQQAGFGGSIIDFNARVAAAARAHEMAFGTRATPGVVFDIARSPVPTPAIAGMFNGVPTMQRQAAARQVAPDVPAPALSAADYAKQIVLAGRSGNLDAYMSAHKDELTTLAKDPKTAAKITRALFDANSEKNQALANNAATFDVGAAAKIAGKVALGSTQVASALVHSPGGAYQTGKALYSDSAALGAAASVKASEAIGARPSDWALAHSDVTPTATASIIKAMGHQMAQDVMHPGQNPGFLFLDVLGFASAGYGTAARLSAAGRALTARGGIVAAAKAAATKPRGGTFEIGREGAKENALLADNPFVAAVQRQRLEKRQKALDFTTINGERVPSGLLSITRSSAAKDWLDENFSFETKIGREADARRRTEHVVNMTIANELEHAAGGSVVQSRALSRIPSPLRKGMTRGEQKAIQVVSWGVTPDEQIAFHQRMIESGIGDAKDHKRQIADLKLAKSALDNPAPRPRFTKALKLTQQVAAESERMRIENLGLSPVTAEDRLAKPGATIRGQDMNPAPTRGPDEITHPEGTLFHGSPEGQLGNVDALHHTKPWREGPGFYLTPSMEKAAKYAEGKTAKAERKTGSGAVNPFRLKPDAKVLDMDAAPASFWRGLADHILGGGVDEKTWNTWASDISPSDAKGASPGVLNRTRLLHVLTGYGELPKTDAYYAIEEALHEKGYHATRHTENGVPVYVVKDEKAIERVAGKTVPGKEIPGEKPRATSQTYAATGPVEPFYTKLEPRGKQKRGPSDAPGFFPTKPGPFGIPTPRPLAELTHEFTGNSIRAGDFRIDATHLTSEAYARTVRAATVLNEHDRLWKSATDTPRTKFDIPIRDSRTVPDELRKILGSMDEGVFTDKEAALLPSDMQTLIHELYPDADKLPKTAIEGVKWVDGRTIGSANEIPTRAGAAVKLMETFQAPVKAVTLFLRPAYILNALGNAGMIVFHQGFSAVPSMARALRASSSLGEETVRTIDALMGQGRSASYSTAITPKLIQAAASAWNVVTDQAFRRSSFIYEARRLGYKTPEQIQELVRSGGKDLVEVKRRANKSMVEFDNLTPFEKNTLRHVIFVYPWVSRSAVWSLRSVMEHPLKTDALAQLGELDENSDPIFAHAPEWFKRVGYFPVGWNNDGTPKLVNPTSVNSFSTLGDMTAILGAGLGGTKYAAFSDLLGPGGQFLQHAITGKDDYGNAYPDKQWLRAAASVLTGLPQVTAYGRGGKKDPNVRPIDVTNRQSAISSFNSNLKRTVFSPGWLNGYGSILAGGLSPRGADLRALEARYWKDATPEQRHQFEVTLLDKAVTLQGGLLKEKVPGRVRQAVALGSDIDFLYKQFAKDHGRQPTTKERASLLIDYLDGKGLMPDGEAATFKKQLAPLVAESDINHLRGAVFGKYGGGDALKQWDADVRLVASFKKDVFQQKTASLYQQGLVKSPVPGASQEDLYAYGRKYLDFTRKVNGIREQIKSGNATTADLRAFEDANDKSVNGLPSFARTAWSYLKPEDQQKAIASSAVASWSSLTSMEKELLGRPSDARVTAGWAKLNEVAAHQREVLAREAKPFPSGYKRVLARWVEKNFNAPGLVNDFDFASKPLYERLGLVKPIQQSKNADQWRVVLDKAAKYAKYLKSPNYNKSQVRQDWRDYVASTLQPWVDEDKGFAAEVARYGNGLLDHLLS